MNKPGFRGRLLGCSLLAGAVLLAIWACHLTSPENPRYHLDFSTWADSLTRYDSILILVKDTREEVLDTVFRGKVESRAQLQDLSAPHFQGGKAIISIQGYEDGKVAYRVDKGYDGDAEKTDSTRFIVLPGTTVQFVLDEWPLMARTSTPLPTVTVEPMHLSDKTLKFGVSYGLRSENLFNFDYY